MMANMDPADNNNNLRDLRALRSCELSLEKAITDARACLGDDDLFTGTSSSLPSSSDGENNIHAVHSILAYARHISSTASAGILASAPARTDFKQSPYFEGRMPSFLIFPPAPMEGKDLAQTGLHAHREAYVKATQTIPATTTLAQAAAAATTQQQQPQPTKPSMPPLPVPPPKLNKDVQEIKPKVFGLDLNLDLNEEEEARYTTAAPVDDDSDDSDDDSD